MSEIQLYAALAIGHRRRLLGISIDATRAGASSRRRPPAAGLLWPILAVGLLQLGLFIAVKRLVRARRTSLR